MKMNPRAFLPAVLVALLCPLMALPASAQSNRPNIGSVEIVVRDIDGRKDIAAVRDGDTLTLPEGMRVRLIMTAVPTGSANRPLYPDTTFSDLSKGGVRITRSNSENSTADLEVVPSRRIDRIETISYQIDESWVPANLRTGRFLVRVGQEGTSAQVTRGRSSSGQAGQGGVSWSVNNDRARELTRALYQGILMREPDAGARSTTEAIQRGDYDALVRAAVGIANSDESRIRVYERQGVCNEQRLLALYKNLLGLSAEQVDRRQWDADLKRMSGGEITRVVEDILRSERFRSRYDLRGTGR